MDLTGKGLRMYLPRRVSGLQSSLNGRNPSPERTVGSETTGVSERPGKETKLKEGSHMVTNFTE